jgi:hypothetical protein
MTILGILLLLLIFLYVVATGLGLTRSLQRHKNLVKNDVITDFEDPNDDYDWATGGYVLLEKSAENKIHGKYSAKCTFLLENQFFPNVTPQVSSPGSTPTPPTWQPEMSLDTTSITQLRVYEWQEFAALKMDILNAQDQPVTYHVQVADSRAFMYETSGPLIPKKITNVSIPLDEMIQKRLDLSNIRSLRFWVDTAGFAQPVVVYLDYIRLEGDATAPKALPTPTPKK